MIRRRLTRKFHTSKSSPDLLRKIIFWKDSVSELITVGCLAVKPEEEPLPVLLLDEKAAAFPLFTRERRLEGRKGRKNSFL
jgi:hypothetical protein